eukprot:snap_masked-scaffold_6-processed-gene-15.37-mRNA-1 protein AED:1.00 eAED:1.00 QI:0/-1/0/0/-1/1/1/0/62
MSLVKLEELPCEVARAKVLKGSCNNAFFMLVGKAKMAVWVFHEGAVAFKSFFISSMGLKGKV